MSSISNPITKRTRIAWIFFGLLSLPYILVYFHRVAPAVVAQELMKDFSISGQILGNLAAVYFYIYTLLQIPAGILSDAWGARRTVAIGSILAGIGSLVFGYSPIIEYAFLGRFLVGLGVSFVFVPMLQLFGKWFLPEDFPKVSGFSIFLGSAGAILASYPLGYLTELWGWRFVFLSVGWLGILAGIINGIFIRESPESMGLPSLFGKTDSSIEENSLSKNKPSVWNLLTQATKHTVNWKLFFVFFGIYGSLMTFQGAWGGSFLIQILNKTKVAASMDILFIGLGLLFGSPFVGYLSGRTGKILPILRIFLLIYSSSWIVLLFIDSGISEPLLRALLFLQGFSASSFILTWTLTRMNNDSRVSGTALGLVNMGGFAGASLLQPLFGFLLDQNWGGALQDGVRLYTLESYRHGLYLCLGVSLLSLVMVLFFLDGKKPSKQ